MVEANAVNWEAVSRRDRWLSAIHEASHLALLQRFGGVGTAEIRPSSTDQPGNERLWTGRCAILCAPGVARFQRGVKKRLGVVRTPRCWNVYVGLAGYVGELVARGEFDTASVQEEYYWDSRDGVVSGSDLDLIALDDPQDRHFLQTGKYVERWWADIERMAKQLEHVGTL